MNSLGLEKKSGDRRMIRGRKEENRKSSPEKEERKVSVEESQNPGGLWMNETGKRVGRPRNCKTSLWVHPTK